MAEFAGGPGPSTLRSGPGARGEGPARLAVDGEGHRGPRRCRRRALLAAVCDEIVDAANDLSYFHEWQPTDMVIWDNWRCLHRVSGLAPEHTRCMHRTTIEGDYGLGRFEE